VTAPRRLLALLLTAVASAASAACLPVEGGVELTVEGLGRVLFRELTTDRARERVTFAGGVCLELGGVEVQVVAEALTLSTTEPVSAVEAMRATVDVLGWRLVAERLVLAEGHASLEAVTLEGHDIVGRARRLEVDLQGGVMAASELELVTPTLRLSARTGTFEGGDVVTVRDAVASSCPCPPEEAPLRVEGASARLALATGLLSIDGGTLVVQGLRVPLPPSVELSEARLAQLEFPMRLGVEAEGERGLVVGVVGSEGASADLAFGRAADPRWRLATRVRAGGDGVDLLVRDGGFSLAATRRLVLAPSLTLLLHHRNEGGRIDHPVQDAGIDLAWAPSWRSDGLSLAGRFGVGAAVSAQRLPTGDVASGRTRAAASVTVVFGQAPRGEASLLMEAGATAYAGAYEGVRWLGLQPRWRRTGGPVTVDLTHVWRGVSGASPFDARVDAVAAASRTDLRLAGTASLPGSRLRAALGVRYDWLPDAPRAARVGFERLRGELSLELPARTPDGLAWRADLVVEGAGALDPRPRRDAFVRAAVALRHEGLAFDGGLAAELGIGPEGRGMRSLVASGAAPFRFGEGGATSVTPYLALDVWPLLARSGGPRLVGHGVALEWETCCGLVSAAYRALPDGSTSTRFSFVLPVRLPALTDLEW
jgi:hypothetical protein